MPRSRRRRPVQAGRRRAPLDVLPPLRWWWIVPVLVVFLIAFLLAREYTREPQTVDSFPPDDIEAARLRVMPYRQSGLIFSWRGEQEPTVFVSRAMWEALPAEEKRELGQALAVAKNARRIQIRDGKLDTLLATCTSAGRCRQPEEWMPPFSADSGAGADAPPRDRD